VGKCPQHLSGNRAVSEEDLEINRPKKMSNRRKYEGKRTESPCSVRLLRRSRAAAINRSGAELLLLFILAAGNFSKMFTTYSHTLVVVLASGLESRNQLRNRQEKNEFYFQL
jgi:hypothetical protein